jgi:hypothetical protein
VRELQLARRLNLESTGGISETRRRLRKNGKIHPRSPEQSYLESHGREMASVR